MVIYVILIHMMQVSTRTEYGLRCMILLAQQPEGEALSIPDIAKNEHLPKHYAQQILLKLRRAGFVKSLRGTQGGFALAMPASRIHVGGLIRHLEGVPFQATCDHFNRRKDCGHLRNCSIRPIWQIISQQLWAALDQISLQQLLGDERSVDTALSHELPILTLPSRSL